MGNKGSNWFVLSIILDAFSWMTNANVDLGIKVITAIFGVIVSIVAIRYYIVARREKKLAIEKMLLEKKIVEGEKK